MQRPQAATEERDECQTLEKRPPEPCGCDRSVLLAWRASTKIEDDGTSSRQKVRIDELGGRLRCCFGVNRDKQGQRRRFHRAVAVLEKAVDSSHTKRCGMRVMMTLCLQASRCVRTHIQGNQFNDFAGNGTSNSPDRDNSYECRICMSIKYKRIRA